MALLGKQLSGCMCPAAGVSTRTPYPGLTVTQWVVSPGRDPASTAHRFLGKQQVLLFCVIRNRTRAIPEKQVKYYTQLASASSFASFGVYIRW